MNYSIFRWIVFVGAVIVSISEWGSPAAFWTLVIVVITGIIIPLLNWVYRKCISFHPITLNYSLVIGALKTPNTRDISMGQATSGFSPNLKKRQDLMAVELNQQYTILLQLKARKSSSISYAELRFTNNDTNKPKVLVFNDINPQSLGLYKVSSSRGGGKFISYRDRLDIMSGKKSKAVDYFCVFNTTTYWRGKLSLRLGLIGADTFLQIPCIVNTGGSMGKDSKNKGQLIKKQFHALLHKVSQPIKKSERGKS